jgi:alkylmercury lyase
MHLSFMDARSQALAARLRASLCCDQPAIRLQLLRLLADGRPVSMEQLARALHIPPEQVGAELRRCGDVEFDAAGAIVGAGLSLTPTPHRFVIRGHQLFTWCALDTLMYPALLQAMAQVESPCPVSGQPIRLAVTPASVADMDPPNAVVSIVVPTAASACGDVRGAFCNHVSFFQSADVAATWRAAQPGAHILSVADAYQLGRVVAQARYGDVPDG